MEALSPVIADAPQAKSERYNLVTPELIELLQRWIDLHQDNDRRRIVELCIPVARAVARQMGNPESFGAERGDYLNLAILNIDKCLRRLDSFDPKTIFWWVCNWAAWGVRRSRAYIAGANPHQVRGRQTIGRVFQDLKSENAGFSPSSAEIMDRLRVVGHRDYIRYVGRMHPNRAIHASEITTPDGEEDQDIFVDDKSVDPVDAAALADQHDRAQRAVSLLMSRLNKTDRRILELMMRGHSRTFIAHKVGLSKERIGQRFYNIALKCRADADLCAALKLQPCEHVRSRRSKLPPAEPVIEKKPEPEPTPQRRLHFNDIPTIKGVGSNAIRRQLFQTVQRPETFRAKSLIHEIGKLREESRRKDEVRIQSEQTPCES